MIKGILSTKISWVLPFFVVVLLLPLFVTNKFYLQLFTTSAIIAILVIGLDLLIGHAGYVSFGHAGFMGIGAYASAIFVTKLGLIFWIALPAAIILTGLVAYIVSIPTFRLSGIYFAIGTLAFGQIVNVVIYNWTEVTGGVFGIIGIPSPFASLTGYYYFALVSLFLVGILAFRLISSPVGRALCAIRENEKLAESSGVYTLKTKRFIFTVSGMIAGFAGALLVHLVGFASPSSFGISTSLEMLVITIVGGAGTLIGPAIAAFVLNLLGQYLATFQEIRLMIYGLVLILIIMFLPGGIMGSIKRRTSSVKDRKGDKINVPVDSTQSK